MWKPTINQPAQHVRTGICGVVVHEGRDLVGEIYLLEYRAAGVIHTEWCRRGDLEPAESEPEAGPANQG